MSTDTEWSSDWKASKQPRKQRKYRANAPHHHRGKLLNAHLAEDVAETVGANSLPVREGDKAEVMRGDFAGETSSVHHVDREDGKIYLEAVERETVSGSETRIAIDPSNLQLVKLNLDDPRRIAKYDVSEEDREAIEAEQVEGAEDEGGAYEEAVEEVEDVVDDETLELSEEDAGAEEADYAEVVSGTVDEVKDAVEAQDLDPAAVLEAEKAGKDRSTLTEWLETRIEQDAEAGSEDIDYDELVGGTIDDVKEAVEDEGLDPEKVLAAEKENKDRVTLTDWLEAQIEGDAA